MWEKKKCFEYDCQKEERKPTREQQETLTSSEEGKFRSLLQSDPFPVSIYIELAVSLVSQQSFISSVEYKVKYTSLHGDCKATRREAVFPASWDAPLVPFFVCSLYLLLEDCHRLNLYPLWFVLPVLDYVNGINSVYYFV